MRLHVALMAITGLLAAAGVASHKDTKFADKELLGKQKFLLEIVYRVEDPLFFEEYIQLGKSFVFNKQDYEFPESLMYNGAHMLEYYQAYQHGVTLPKGEYFGALIESHSKQLYGLLDFFYFAKNWEIFKRNVCWARLHANEGLFVQALTLAVIHRKDMDYLFLPTIYEILPQYFFNRNLIYQAEKFDYDVWSKYNMYEKEYKDFLYKDYSKYFEELDSNYHIKYHNYFYTKDWKLWQWWKLMGLEQQWYAEKHFMLRDNADIFNRDPKFIEMIKDVKKFWMPVDYSRDLGVPNKESALTYFTEDVEWNAYFYYFNLDYAPFLSAEFFGLKEDRRGQYFFYFVRQMIARYYLERLSHGYGEIPELSFFTPTEYGYNPQLVHYNGVGYSYRPNYYDYQTYGNFQSLHKILNFLQRIEDIISRGFYVTAQGQNIDVRTPEAIESLGDMMQGNVDALDQFFFTVWYTQAHRYFAQVHDNMMHVQPHVLLNYETMMRDPLFFQFYKKVSDVFYQFYQYIDTYTHTELLLPGVEIKEVNISKLVTYFDLFDYDVTNLLNDKPIFVNGQFVWDKTLLARQMRLNHKPFDIVLTINSQKEEKVVLRTFIGPKYDEFGRVMSLNENRKNFIEIDELYYELKAGQNIIKRSSKDYYWSNGDRTTYTELYKYVMAAFEGKYEFPLDYYQPHCGFPDRLLLPRGWSQGMPMQFFFMVYPYTASYAPYSSHEYAYVCGISSGVRHLDDVPYGYPLDREINELEFFVPNLYFKDVKIYHEDNFEKYYDHKYEKFGSFDYGYYYNF
ncbi:arylphorin subunit C223 [Stomoxys calcitrans]|uniref:arylphorin subunit C223 n=1 Tax=Stomoxys calcitrans TaxID=35570 RepID=UPI0027E2230C|nr:arylphorin subunit C223 [Stomoxys calcitrans]